VALRRHRTLTGLRLRAHAWARGRRIGAEALDQLAWIGAGTASRSWPGSGPSPCRP